MVDQPGLGQLLEEISSADEATRLEKLRGFCEPLGVSQAGAVLRGLLSCPVKWQRDLAADVANAMDFDPFSEEDEVVEAEEAAPVLTLGFDDDPEEDLVPATDTVDIDDGPPVTFLGPCVEPHESGAEAVFAATGKPGPRASLGIWIAFGLAALAGIALLRYLTADL